MFFIDESHFVTLFIITLSPLYHNATKLELKVCGSEQSCLRNNTKQQTGKDICCRPCECEDICSEKGTCCPDKKEHIATDREIKQKCLTLYHIPEGYSLPLYTSVVSYFIRASCPKDFTDINIKAKCEHGNVDALVDVRPVSSNDGKVIYKNKYCSYCHGEKNTIGWNVIVHNASPFECKNMIRLGHLNINTFTTILLANCILAFIPPKYINIWNHLCFDEAYVIRQCNITRKWETFESDVNNLCLNQSDGYFVFDISGNVYGNINCLKCNGRREMHQHQCNNLLSKFTNIPSLFTLINVDRLLDQDISKKQTRRCGNDEILDTYFNTCRTLYCVYNTMPFNGHCVPFVVLPHGQSYHIFVRLIPNAHIKKTQLTEDDLKKNYFLIQEELGFGDCGLCHMRMYLEKNITENILHEMYVEFKITPTAQCKTAYIWSKILAAETKQLMAIRLTVNNTWIEFKVFMNDSVDIPIRFFEIVQEIGRRNKCVKFKHMRGELCPKIKLLQHEVKITKKYHPRTDQLIWSPNMNDINDSAFVCTHTYILYPMSAMSRKHQSSSLMLLFVVFAWSYLFTIL